jgi:hypothetical protein
MLYKGKLLLIALFYSFLIQVQAQVAKPVEMADTMRSNGKIYVVVAVILTLFAGLIIYLVSLDKKISRLEKGAD